MLPQHDLNGETTEPPEEPEYYFNATLARFKRSAGTEEIVEENFNATLARFKLW